MTIYAVCENLQKTEISQYCFNECGEIRVGGIVFNGMAWLPCKIEKCPFVDREINTGEASFDGCKEDLVLRKLKPYVAAPPDEER